jgi:nitrite reductase/ring-hydroxylating ferredoxin subunit
MAEGGVDTPSNDAGHGAQQLVGFRGNAEWEELLDRVDRMVAEFEGSADQALRERVLALLDGIDAIHREALTRLVRLFKDGVLEKVITDPAIRTLMELYDLLPNPGAPDFITGYPPPKTRRPEGARIDSSGVADRVPIPHFVPVLNSLDELPAHAALARSVDGRAMLIARAADRPFAFAAHCASDGAAMHDGTLDGYIFSCPIHAGCHYDIRQGTRIGGGGAIACYALRVAEDGRVLVGIDVPFTPQLPTF